MIRAHAEGEARVPFTARVAERLRAAPHLAVLGGLLAAGVLLRGALMLEWRPAFLGYSDIYGLISNSRGGDLWFGDPQRPIGYPLFLAGARSLFDDLSFTTLLQHALGIAAAVGSYFAGRALGLRGWFALAAPAVLLLHGSTIFFEHTILTEAVFIPAMWGGLTALALARGRQSARARLSLCVAAGLCVAYAGATRTVGVVLLPLAVLWVVWAFDGRLRSRFAAAAVVLVSGVALLAGDLIWAHEKTDSWAFARNGFYQYYGRVASFADCSRFTPPAGTENLCPTMPPSEREGATFFLFNPSSPVVTAYGPVYSSKPPEVAERVKSFSRAAALGQPLDYIETVARDMARLVSPNFPLNPNPAIGNRGAGFGPDGYATVLPERDSGGIEWAKANMNLVANTYDTTGTRHGSIGFLRFWERNTRLVGVPFVIMALLAAAGVAFRDNRRPAALFAGFAAAMLFVPPVIALYNWRYELLAIAPLAAAAAFGAQALSARLHVTWVRTPRGGDAHS